MIKKYNKGATILEIIIYIFLLLSLLLVLMDVFSSLMNLSSESTSNSEVVNDGKFISQRFYYQISQASAINIPANLGDTNTSLSLEVNGTSINYYLSGENIYQNDGTSIERVNNFGTKIPAFTVTRLGNSGSKPTLKINFTVESTISQSKGRESKNYSVTVGTR